MLRFNDIVEKVQAYHPKADISLLQRAYIFTAKVHKGQVRASGEPYLTHPVEVAGLLADLHFDIPTIATGLLHDTVEDTLATIDEIREMFGEEVAYLVDGVTKLAKVQFRNREERQAESFRKMVMAMSKDLRIILVKLCDRLHNMRTIDFLQPEKRIRVAEETIDIYAPIASRLGIQWIKSELEDLSFKVMMPEVYAELKTQVEAKQKERSKIVDRVAEQVRAKLTESNITADVYGRAKHLYSIFRKMHDSRVDLDEIYDIIAIRTIVTTVRECYETLGIVHSLYTPVPGRLKDYIALPKPNLYQSLHTTLITPGGQPVEIQIRTQQMHQVAEHGVAAHWLYKEGGTAQAGAAAAQFSWLRNMVEAGKDISDSGEFMESLKFDLFPDEVYVFTPKGDVRMLPKGATPIDFAFSIHTDVGLQCIGAKVNGAIVTLETPLRDGDIVTVQTRQNHRPSKDWLQVVKTARARSKLREYFRTEERSRAIEIGRDILDRELQKHGIPLQSMDKAELARTADKLGFRDADKLLIAISYDTIGAPRVVEHLLPPDKRPAPRPAENSFKKLFNAFRTVGGTAEAKARGVRVQGHDDVLVRYAKCCSPLPGDKITGFITRGRGITVHRSDCEAVYEMIPERKIAVEWADGARPTRPVRIEVVCVDKPGMLALFTQTIANLGVNLNRCEVFTTIEKKAVATFDLEVQNLQQLQNVTKELRKIKGVLQIHRVDMNSRSDSPAARPSA
ncbi:MAG: bifunctional (p)ppGpp synthetase/guanosine-3',5'-bis(diphosphate) 3'-pyrophosphohydrolase [Deltaproteobacteria bacterium]|nr:bifunctional (p)ppGpp synthetase/guanosine-3',5'-bis(diphosphate) 3'-pyrophosphohydrolase [Deltaproteobacteria bacterium]